MRALGFLLLLLLPLSAGETDRLARAVARFNSDYAAERDAASQTVRELLQAELGPLLAALKSDDPEVSRRARRAIASLLPPGREEQEAAERSAAGGGNMIIGFGGAANRQFRVIVKQGKGGQIMFLQGGDQKQNEALRKFGLEGDSIDDTLVRRQLQLAAGRGFGVTKVLAGTSAARLGLKAYDIILSIGDRPVQRLDKVLQALGKKEAWGDLRMTILRVGKVVQLGTARPRGR